MAPTARANAAAACGCPACRWAKPEAERGERAAAGGEPLVRHLREAHAAQLGDAARLQRLQHQAGFVHAAMHNGRAHPGHFHHGDQVLHLWDATGPIRQVDTCGRT